VRPWRPVLSRILSATDRPWAGLLALLVVAGCGAQGLSARPAAPGPEAAEAELIVLDGQAQIWDPSQPDHKRVYRQAGHGDRIRVGQSFVIPARSSAQVRLPDGSLMRLAGTGDVDWPATGSSLYLDRARSDAAGWHIRVVVHGVALTEVPDRTDLTLITGGGVFVTATVATRFRTDEGGSPNHPVTNLDVLSGTVMTRSDLGLKSVEAGQKVTLVIERRPSPST
jgi:hypothetical protein